MSVTDETGPSRQPKGDTAEMKRVAQEEMDALGQQAEAELSAMDHRQLVKKYLELQRAYVSALNAVMLFKRQLSAMREHTLKSGQIAELSRKVNIADIDIISNVAVQDVPLFFEAEYGALFLYDHDTELLTLQRSWPDTPEQPPLSLTGDADTMLIHHLNRTREPGRIANFAAYEKDSGQDLRRIPADEPLEKGALLCPLAVGMQDRKEMLVGLLTVARKPAGFTQHDVDMAVMMSEMIATAVSTSRLIEQMSRLAETDGLTQLYNHRHFQQELDRAVAATNRYKTDLALAMIDIDHFKSFNDDHGHQAGDHVLREVARFIRMAVREQVDIPARYGGEEFAIIMPNTNLNGAKAAGERIRAAIESAAIQLGSQTAAVSVSVGVAQYAQPQPKNALIDMADMALYRAKREGRNRVIAAEPSS